MTDVTQKELTFPQKNPHSIEDFQTMCGTWMKGHANYAKVDLPDYETLEGYSAVEARADGLDWRTKAPQCTVIAKIRDQSACGSCWAFGSTETFEDRRCIAGKGDQEFSSQDTAGCCKGAFCGFSAGCGGGQPSAALKWMGQTGVVTGGDFYDIGAEPGAGCTPYQLQPCAHHVPATSKYPVALAPPLPASSPGGRFDQLSNPPPSRAGLPVRGVCHHLQERVRREGLQQVLRRRQSGRRHGGGSVPPRHGVRSGRCTPFPGCTRTATSKWTS